MKLLSIAAEGNEETHPGQCCNGFFTAPATLFRWLSVLLKGKSIKIGYPVPVEG
jgi:hypothetical protein